MNLKRPIIFLDIEATGADSQRDRIVEIALIKMNPDRSLTEVVHRINPGIKIPAEVVALHGISNDSVMNAPGFKDLAPALLDFMAGSDFGGFGLVRFDIPILTEEFKRAGFSFPAENCAVIDGLAIYHQRERRDLSAAYQFYCQKTLVGAHGARADALASLEVVIAQLDRYPDLPRDTASLHDYCNRQDDRYVDSHRKFMWKDGEAAINFGKHKGELLKNLVRQQRDYVEWLVSDGKFSQDVVDICWKALRGEFPTKNGDSKTQQHVKPQSVS